MPSSRARLVSRPAAEAKAANLLSCPTRVSDCASNESTKGRQALQSNSNQIQGQHAAETSRWRTRSSATSSRGNKRRLRNTTSTKRFEEKLTLEAGSPEPDLNLLRFNWLIGPSPRGRTKQNQALSKRRHTLTTSECPSSER